MSTKEKYKETLNNIVSQVGIILFNKLVREINTEHKQEEMRNCQHKFVSSPICGDPDYCVKCGKTGFIDEEGKQRHD